MIRNYLKVALRNLVNGKLYSLINISGLAVGMAVAMLIGLWIYDELSFDKSNENYESITQVFQHLTNNGEVQTQPYLPFPLADELRKNYGSDFKNVALIKNNEPALLSFADKKLSQKGGYFEPQFLDMMNIKLLRGSNKSLDDPNAILLSESSAKAFFGDGDPMDKIIKINNNLDVKVTGVFADLPQNSTFYETQFMAPWQHYYNNNEWVKNSEDPWRPNAFEVFAQLAEKVDLKKASIKIKDAKLKNLNAELAKKKPELFLLPMSDWHLKAEFKNGINTGGRIQYVWLFGLIGIFVLLLACINFMNLSTARSEKRAKEVGIRKAIGSARSHLIYQFFVESLMIVAISFVVALIMVQAFLATFNEVSDKNLGIPWSNSVFWLLAFSFTFLTGIIAGGYPALYLSSFQPIKILKGTFSLGKWASVPRKVLVVVQFTVSVTLIIGTIVVFRQIQHAKDRPLGYDTNGLILIPLIGNEINKHFDAVKEELMQSRAIEQIALGGSPTTEIWGTSSGFKWKGKDPNLSIDFPRISVSYDYGKTIDWKFKEGRDFSKDFLTDDKGFVINEAAAKFMGLINPIGETIFWFGEPHHIIGVVEDIIMKSPYEEVRPTIFYMDTSEAGFAFVKLNADVSNDKGLGQIESVFKKYNPAQPFEYRFVDEDYNYKFGNEQRIGKLATLFASLAIFISCLGLFGLASFIAEQRTKEIGVRKVLGATVVNIWTLLSKDFMYLVLISLLIATPIAAYLMNNWVKNYTYHTDISWWVFVVTGLGAIVITLLTVSFQAVKAALLNPVKSLRSE